MDAYTLAELTAPLRANPKWDRWNIRYDQQGKTRHCHLINAAGHAVATIWQNTSDDATWQYNEHDARGLWVESEGNHSDPKSAMQSLLNTIERRTKANRLR